MHLDTYADYLRQAEPHIESRAVRALLTTGGPPTKKLHGHYVEVYGPYQVMLNVDGKSIYTRTYVTSDSDQMGQIYLGHEKLKVRRIGHDGTRCSSHRVRSRCDCASSRHQWKENWSNRTTEYRSSAKRDINKDFGKIGLHVGLSNSNDPQISPCRKTFGISGTSGKY